MAMVSATLGTQLQNMTPVGAEATAIDNFANAWETYFSTAAAGAVPYVPLPAAKTAMKAAMTGLSSSGQGAAKIQAGITSWWGAIVASAAAAFPSATLVVPPATLSGIAAALSTVLTANTSGKLSLAASCSAIATSLHTNNLGGTATLPGPVVTPIL